MKKNAFTLIELLIVIAILMILSGVLFLILRPSEIIGKAGNARRWTDINVLSSAIRQYSLDHGGTFPTGVTTTLSQIGTCTSGGDTNCAGASSSCVNLTSDLSLYIPNIPIDPNGDMSHTGYGVLIDSTGLIHVEACLAENEEIISTYR